MATDLKSIKATIEIPKLTERESLYAPTDINLTSFYGGEKRGHSLQLGFVSSDGNYHFVQLDNNSVKTLIKELTTNFNK